MRSFQPLRLAVVAATVGAAVWSIRPDGSKPLTAPTRTPTEWESGLAPAGSVARTELVPESVAATPDDAADRESALTPADAEEREEALLSLYGSRDGSALSRFAAALVDDDPWVRDAAKTGIYRHADRAAAMAVLLGLLASPSRSERVTAAELLEEMGADDLPWDAIARGPVISGARRDEH